MVELRETFVASVYGWCCRLCEDLVCIINSKLAFSEALQLADVFACGT